MRFRAYPFISSIYMGGFWMKIFPCFWALINEWNFHAYPFISSNYVGGFWMKIVPCFGHWLMDEISVPIYLSHPFMVVGGGGDSKWRSFLALGIDLMDEISVPILGDESIQESKQKIMSVSLYWCIGYTYAGDSGWKTFLPLGNWWMDENPHAYVWDE